MRVDGEPVVAKTKLAAGDTVQIVRAITTYTKNAAGTDDVSLLDLTTIRTLDYVRKACCIAARTACTSSEKGPWLPETPNHP